MYLCNEMNKSLTRILCLFMAFQVLFASTGFSMYEHFCKIKGAKTYSLSIPKKSCCSIKSPRTALKSTSKSSSIKRSKCCSDHVTHYKINPNSLKGKQIDFKSPVLVFEANLTPTYDYTQADTNIAYLSLPYTSNAPPIAGRERIILIQSFLI
jgi:hypothetical protein